MSKPCFKCGESGAEFYGYGICNNCKDSLRLFKQDTIDGYIKEYKEDGKSYLKTIENRLEEVEKIYITAKIKLLDIREKICGSVD